MADKVSSSSKAIREMSNLTRATADVARALFGEFYLRDFDIVLWDGTRVPAQRSQRFTLLINEPGAMRTALTRPVDLFIGRAFAAGLIDVEGDLEYAIDLLYRATASMNLRRHLLLMKSLRRLPKAPLPSLNEAALRGRIHSRPRDRAAIAFHYDRPIEFYATFLDPKLVYSCAYYDDGIETLDDAQSAKLDYVLRKVRLGKDERLLDIGCGYGALIIRAAQRFGARSVGITLSQGQYEEAQRRIAAAGVGDRVRVELRDYRDLRGETFDKVVSIGMFEHVGRKRLPQYFRAAFAALRPGGLFLNHGIAKSGDRRSMGKTSGFMERFIFPDGELVTISDALGFAQRAGLEIRDVENLREHYARTLRAWITNLQNHRQAAVIASGEESYRTWRLFLAGSAQGFAVGRMDLFQAILARPTERGRVDIPPTRHDLYNVSSTAFADER
jgi:cyclopropane-fatty-acyl-phospholipid synthase